ncbi:alpha/beta fold hydrolase [Nocardioides aestuarii]|uniref:Alpha/beta fold hydrolase n=1 Tax=Nocardioides aestuarii TaxID=252231 RepID=A0ABW4TV86_9ACTN
MVESRYEVQYLTIHGHRRAFVKAGSGPVVLLLHGLGCDHTTWEPVIDSLSRRYTVIAPDLLGHGLSDKPRADYSVGGYANGMRDLLTCLGIDRATVVGHSFGGGVAMQFAYQFPERTERLVLVGSGGLGPEVSPIIRAITTPGFHPVMSLLTLPGVRHVGKAGLVGLSRLPSRHTRDLDEVAEIYESFKDPAARHAIRHVVRAVVDWRGQIVTMADRAYLTQVMPMAVIWGEDDQVIPVKHAEHAAELAPDARVEVIPNAGHFPHKDHPQRFAKVVHEFIRTTQPATYSRARFRSLLRAGRPIETARDRDASVTRIAPA